MIHTAARNRRSLPAIRKLVRRHYFQVRAKPQPADLANVLAIAFRPNAFTGSFNGGLLRRVGTTAMIVLSYEPSESKRGRLAMPIRGFRATAYPDGSVRYGDDERCLFHYDGSQTPRVRRSRGAINPARNPALLETLLRLDYACKRQLDRIDRLPEVPQLPKIWLGFAPQEPPDFEDTPALRRLAASELGIPIERLGANGDVLLQRLLRDTWRRQLIHPSAPGNPTGTLLVDAELCTQARRALRVYEDFSALVGAHTWNPAREVKFLELDNPARHVLRRYEIDAGQNFNQPLSDELIEQLELAMREAIGPQHNHFTLEEIFDALTNPDWPLVAYARSLPDLRSQLSPEVAQCCTDDDLLRCARDPAQPLTVSGACRVQVLKRRCVSESYKFSSVDLSRRIEAELGGKSRFGRPPRSTLAPATAAAE